jgi:hypothetical protein
VPAGAKHPGRALGTPRRSKAQRSGRPFAAGGVRPVGLHAAANGVWVSAAETPWYRRGGEGSEGCNPRSAVGLKTAGWGRRGENRREGNQTLRAEGGGLAKPVRTESGGLECAEGEQSSGEPPASRLRKPF